MHRYIATMAQGHRQAEHWVTLAKTPPGVQFETAAGLAPKNGSTKPPDTPNGGALQELHSALATDSLRIH
jgi:hypothetical protein